MSDNIVDLRRRRNNCEDFTPLETLKDLVARVESGELKPSHLFVVLGEVDDDRGGWDAHTWSAGGNPLECIGLLAFAMHNRIRDKSE